MEQVVTVGLDGSAESLAAARWAADEAERRELGLRLTHAWILLCPPTPDSPAAEEQNYWAKRIVHDAHTELARGHPKLTIIEDLVADEAETALLDAAARSRMLVLGSRGLDRVASFFLGDIGSHTIARAERPVVLMRAGREADGQPATCGRGPESARSPGQPPGVRLCHRLHSRCATARRPRKKARPGSHRPGRGTRGGSGHHGAGATGAG